MADYFVPAQPDAVNQHQVMSPNAGRALASMLAAGQPQSGYGSLAATAAQASPLVPTLRGTATMDGIANDQRADSNHIVQAEVLTQLGDDGLAIMVR